MISKARSWLAETLAGQITGDVPLTMVALIANLAALALAVERMNTLPGVLRRTGADGQAARRAYGALHTDTIGFAALEASQSRRVADASEGKGSLAQQLAAYSTTEQFTAGLHYLLDGIGRHPRTGPATACIEEERVAGPY